MKSRRTTRTILSACAAVGMVAGMTTTAQADVLMEVPNPGFEIYSEADGYEGWNPFSRPEFVKTSTEIVYEGERSLHIHDTSTERGGGLLSDPIPITGGETYVVNTKIYKESGGNAQIYLRFQDAEGNQLVNVNQITPIPTGEWADAGIQQDAPAEAVTATILLYAAVNTTSSLYYDNVTLTMLQEEPVDPADCELSAATAGRKLVGNATNLWGTAVDCGTTLTVEARDGDAWAAVGEVTPGDDGFFVFGLDEAAAAAGDHEFRVTAYDGEAASEPVTLTRVAPTTASVAKTTLVDRGANAWGTVDGPAKVSTQVRLPDGRWSTSQTVITEDGGYVVPLTYGRSSAGELEWRLVVDHAHGEREVTPVMTQRRLGRPSTEAMLYVPALATSWVTGSVDQPGARVWTEVRLPNGTWSRSQQGTADANGDYAYGLTYGRGYAGTYHWRVGVHYDGLGTLYSKEFIQIRG